MKKKIQTAVIIGCAVMGLAACGGKTVYVVDSLPEVPGVEETDAPETTKAPKATPAPTRPPSSQPPVTTGSYDEDAFFYAVESNAPSIYAFMANSDILDMGLIICETLDTGASIQEVSAMLVRVMANTGTTSYASDVAGVTAAALLYLCPEHKWWLDTL